ncbi:MAG: N-acetylmuramoyl-L-alanine amidase [Gammaproteobacteria bacterium]|nr:N-acetylmuramoyl-L-alanine amidase [Gammaproteobacteria bacterium]
MSRDTPSRVPVALALVLLFPAPFQVSAQAPDGLAVTVLFPDGREASLPVETTGGYPVLPAVSLDALGWRLGAGEDGRTMLLGHRTGLELELVPGSPFVGWDGIVVQMVEAPYWSGEVFFVPLQLVADLLPGFLPDAYVFEEDRALLLAEGAEAPPVEEEAGAGGVPPAGDLPAAADSVPTAGEDPAEEEEQEDASGGRPLEPWSAPAGGAAAWVIIIDPGHGGGDTGVVGTAGLEEKEAALSAAVALARVLARRPDAEVWLTRDRDVEVPLRSRGEWANEWRDGRPGAFISIHANALPDREGVRGFETYILADAETEQERRVAEAEGASPDEPLPYDPTVLEFREASSLLAGEVQWELGEFHPGPDRGVRRGPIPSLFGVRMPAIAVEVGFLTNPEEERLLGEATFHREVAEAIGRAVDRFLEAYPGPGVP